MQFRTTIELECILNALRWRRLICALRVLLVFSFSLFFFDMDPCGLSQVMNENEYVQLLAADNERCNSVS